MLLMARNRRKMYFRPSIVWIYYKYSALVSNFQYVDLPVMPSLLSVMST